MAIEFACPSCGGILRVEDDAVGQVVRCGGCMAMLRVPDLSAPPARDSATSFPSAPTSFPEAEPFPMPGDRPTARPVPEPRLRRDESPPVEPPRPRRRRRREAPVPTGRGPVFWVLITLCVTGLGSCISCCGLLGMLGAENWRRLESSQGGFKVDVPAAPRTHFKPHLFRTDDKFTIEGARMFGTNLEFFVMYKEVENVPPGRDGAEKVLDELIARLKQGGIRLDGKPIADDVDGFPGRQFSFQDTQGGQCVARVVVADHRVYILVAAGTLNPPPAEMVQRFFGSFRFTDPKILAAVGKGKNGKQPPAKDDVQAAPKATSKDGLAEVARPNRERLRIYGLGAQLGNLPFVPIATDIETARIERARKQESVAGLGRAVAAASADAVEGEHRRALIGKLGAVLGSNALQVLEWQQAHAMEEARVRAIGEAIGKAALGTAETATPSVEKAPPPREKP